MKLSSSVITAIAIVAIVTLYFGARAAFKPAPGESEETGLGDQPFGVVALTVKPAEWRDEITVRGRTEALRKVTVRAETAGVVATTPARLGDAVREGDSLCQLRIEARDASLNEARAALRKAELDFNAARELAKDGFQADTTVAARRASLDLARAGVEQARIAVEKTNIKAPFDGVFDERMVEIGDFLGVGDPCGVVIQREPFLVTGAVSERDVTKLKIGDPGRATLSTGETIDGTVRFIATGADPATRTFRIELEIPNPDGALKDGVTADFKVFAAERQAHLVPRSSLTLDDAGRLSLRHIVDADTVASAPVSLLGEDPSGVWVSGLEGDAAVIVRGQDFVAAGQKVAVTLEGEDRPGAGSIDAKGSQP